MAAPLHQADKSPSSTSEEEKDILDGYESPEKARENQSSSHRGVPEPRGEPSKLTASQRMRLHELIRSGQLPRGLDRTASDEELWKAYRKEMKDKYRALRKRKRADGTWTKDDDRGWGPVRPSNVQSNRDRSPLPRRRPPSST